MNKTVLAVIFAVSFGGVACSTAIAATTPSQSSRAPMASFPSVVGTVGSVDQLLRVHATGLARTPTNITSVRGALAGKTSDDERVILIRILGDLADPADRSAAQSALMADLKAHTQSGKKEIARAATFAISRAGYSEDLKEILIRGKSSGTLSKDEYFGELSHVLPFAPKQTQLEIVGLLTTERNPYAIDILANQFSDGTNVNKIYPETQRALQGLLRANEPNFPMSIGTFSLIDGFRYANWLHSYASISESLDRKSYADTVFAELNSPKTDPRKVIAFLSGDQGKKLMKNVGRKAPFEPSLARSRAYAESLPQNTLLAGIVGQIGQAVAALN